MFPVYGGKCLSHKAVHNWVEKFSQGCSKVTDDAWSGRCVEIATEATVQRVGELIWADRRITIGSVATALGCSHGLAYSIMDDHLEFRKVCSWWVPRELKDRDKINWMSLSLHHLLMVCRWRKFAINEKFKVTASARKVMLTVFWESQRVLLAHFQKCGENVNSASYCEVLLKLPDAIRSNA
jgi:hypothetical protein